MNEHTVFPGTISYTVTLYKLWARVPANGISVKDQVHQHSLGGYPTVVAEGVLSGRQQQFERPWDNEEGTEKNPGY